MLDRRQFIGTAAVAAGTFATADLSQVFASAKREPPAEVCKSIGYAVPIPLPADTEGATAEQMGRIASGLVLDAVSTSHRCKNQERGSFIVTDMATLSFGDCDMTVVENVRLQWMPRLLAEYCETLRGVNEKLVPPFIRELTAVLGDVKGIEASSHLIVDGTVRPVTAPTPRYFYQQLCYKITRKEEGEWWMGGARFVRLFPTEGPYLEYWVDVPSQMTACKEQLSKISSDALWLKEHFEQYGPDS